MRTTWLLWLAMALLSCIGMVVSFFNFWAACDLGYDRTPEGKKIITVWCYALLGTLAMSIVMAVLAVRSWMKSRVPVGVGETQQT